MVPKLSIITINLNNHEGLHKSIRSVSTQTFKDFEYLVIDGGSNDSSIDIIYNYGYLISKWVSEKDEGIYSAMNKGISLAEGEYIYFLNSGDYLINDTILDSVFGQELYEDIIYGDIFTYLDEVDSFNLVKSIYRPSLISLLTGPIHHQSSFIRRNLFNQFDLYNEKFKIRADWDFWIRSIVLNNCTTRYLCVPIAYYNLNGFSSGCDQKQLFASETRLILESHFPRSIILDCYNWISEKKKMEYYYEIKEISTINAFVAFLNKMRRSLIKKLLFKSLCLIPLFF